MKSKNAGGHLAALITILVWGVTYISTKVLLTNFKPIEILFIRFVIGTVVLFIVHPKLTKLVSIKQELIFAAAGLSGICLYYLLENIALTYTFASNVSVISTIAPFMTAIVAKVFFRSKEKLHARFFVGFGIAMVGICLISFNGTKFSLSPKGDVLALLSTVAWAFYSNITKKVGEFGYNTIVSTRKTFIYGIIFMIPAMVLFDFHLGLGRFTNPTYLFNILFLGLGASALCFASWNYSIKIIGVMKSSVYIYLIPVVTVVISMFVLGEKITVLSGVGIVLALTGLILSEKRTGRNKR